MPTAKRRPSMSDVARHAGVSLGTVSNVLNNPDRVRPAVISRVRAAISEIGWVPNDAARSLAAGRSSTLGIVVADLANSLFVELIRGAADEAGRHGLSMLIADSFVDPVKERESIRLFEQARVAGILLAPSPTLESVEQRPTSGAAVLVNAAPTVEGVSGVVTDEEYGGYIAAKHLLDAGRHSLVFVGTPDAAKAVQSRLDGARKAVAEHPDASLRLFRSDGLDLRHGRAAARQLMSGPGPVDGVVCASDLLAVGCIQEFDTDPDWAVPDRVAVTGYDDNHFAAQGRLAVTTVKQPAEFMGREGVRILLREIENPAEPHVTVVLKPSLIVRGSSEGAPRRT